MTSTSFKRPEKLPIQIIGPTVLAKARDAYFQRWKRTWPENDSYLAELVIDAKEIHNLLPTSKAGRDAVLETTLELMREDHEF